MDSSRSCPDDDIVMLSYKAFRQILNTLCVSIAALSALIYAHFCIIVVDNYGSLNGLHDYAYKILDMYTFQMR